MKTPPSSTYPKVTWLSRFPGYVSCEVRISPTRTETNDCNVGTGSPCQVIQRMLADLEARLWALAADQASEASP